MALPRLLHFCFVMTKDYLPQEQYYYWHGLTVSLVHPSGLVAQSPVESRFATLPTVEQGIECLAFEE